MKKVAILALTLMASVVRADMSFVCDSVDVVYLNLFSAEGTIVTESEVGVDAVDAQAQVTIIKTKAGKGQGQILMSEISAEGTSRLVTEMTKEPFVYSQLKFEANGDKYVLKVLADFPGNLSSKLTNISKGFEYKANCKTVEVE